MDAPESDTGSRSSTPSQARDATGYGSDGSVSDERTEASSAEPEPVAAERLPPGMAAEATNSSDSSSDRSR